MCKELAPGWVLYLNIISDNIIISDIGNILSILWTLAKTSLHPFPSLEFRDECSFISFPMFGILSRMYAA